MSKRRSVGSIPRAGRCWCSSPSPNTRAYAPAGLSPEFGSGFATQHGEEATVGSLFVRREAQRALLTRENAGRPPGEGRGTEPWFGACDRLDDLFAFFAKHAAHGVEHEPTDLDVGGGARENLGLQGGQLGQTRLFAAGREIGAAAQGANAR